MELLAPKPLCNVVSCDDVERVGVGVALAELKKEQEIVKLFPEIYAQRYDFKRLSPSLINDSEYCPRLLWIQRRLGFKLFTEKSIVAVVKGKLLHERYERAMSQYDNVITEYKIEIDGLVGVVDMLIKRGKELIPVEIKTGASKEAHKIQLQIYMSMLKTRTGYLVYRDRVEAVEESKDALALFEKMREVLNSEAPPPSPPKRCARCPLRPICRSILIE